MAAAEQFRKGGGGQPSCGPAAMTGGAGFFGASGSAGIHSGALAKASVANALAALDAALDIRLQQVVR